MPDSAFPAGPIFGPDSVVIEVRDGAGSTIAVPVRPDARNVELRAAGQPTQYYFQPTRVSLAQRQSSPEFDFSMTALVRYALGPHPEYIGGSCTLAVTLAVPDSVTAGIVDALMAHHHPDPPPRISALFNHRDGDPAPGLRMVPVTRSAISCVVGDPRTGTAPIVVNAEGSIEAQGRNTFLVSCTPAVAEEIVTSLRDRTVPPFLVRNVLTEQFATGPATLTADLQVDVDKLYDAFSAAMPGSVAENADVLYQAGMSADAVRVDPATGAQVDALNAWLNDTDAIKEAVFGMVKDQLFDVGPDGSAEPGAPGPTWWDDVFGHAKVTLKQDHARTGVSLRHTVTLHGAVPAGHTVEGDLSELAGATKGELDKYLTVIEAAGFQ
ncbi:MAG: hypothetical protein ACRDP6_38910 [Actinoallomurus sp.]